MWYTVTELELLAIVETLCEYKCNPTEMWSKG
jgi:hypothetical protein